MGNKVNEELDALFEFNEFTKSIKYSDSQIYISLETIMELSPYIFERIANYPEKTLQELELKIKDRFTYEGTVRLVDIPKSIHLAIRENRSKHINSLVCFEGVIRQAGEVLSRVYSIKFECPACGNIVSMLQTKEEIKEPKKCSCGRSGGFRSLSENMIDTQTIVLEENADSLDSAKQPKRIHMVLEDGLVEYKLEKRALPGTRIIAVGTLKDIELKKGSTKRTRILDVNNVIPMDESEDFDITEEDETKIKELSKTPGLLTKFTDSYASSILGNEHIKRAIILQLLGGSRRIKSDGQYTRDNIHVLLVGSRSTGKSVLLKNTYEMLPKARMASGKGSSGVGLTATVTKDEVTGQYMLESGAIPLANRSIVIFDEADKVSANDRDYLHECMEDGRISISKANIQATLQAQTSILAAANPKNSEFNQFDDIAHQINMPLTLISRFDCIFIMKDEVKEVRDELIADKILNEHTENHAVVEISKDIMKKYIMYARKLTPVLSAEAIQYIKEFYTKLRREGQSKKVIQISPRQLEGIIRLAEASAKFRLSNTAEVQDAEVAIEVMKSWLKDVGYNKEGGTFDINSIMEPPKSKKAKFDVILSVYRQQQKQKLFCWEVEKAIDESIIPKDDIWEIMKQMKLHGYFYEPSRGLFQLIV